MKVNPGGIEREALAWALKQEGLVLHARKRDSCLLCRSPKVNEAGLCRFCHALLRDDEIRLAEKWLSGTAP